MNETWSVNSEWHGNKIFSNSRRFQGWGFQNVFKENFNIKAKISRGKCWGIFCSKIAPVHSNQFPQNYRKIVLWQELFSVRKKAVHLWKLKSKIGGT